MDEVLNSVERVQSHGMVLVADDDPNFSANMVEVLKEKGYRVQVARTGKQALDTVLAGGIDILVLDLQLPVVSGLEVYMELQKRGRALPTVCVTGYSHDQHLSCSTGGTMLVIPEFHPAIGAADYYLVVSESGSQEGSYGTGTIGGERPVSASACHATQDLRDCGP